MAGRAGEKPVVALAAPDKPTVVLSEPARAPSAGPAPAIAIRTVEAGEEGAFFATGTSPAGAAVRLYLNNSLIATVEATPQGTWALRVERGQQWLDPRPAGR